MTAHGTSNLTPKQSDLWERRFGVRYVTVQETPYTRDEKGKIAPRASREERRRNRFRPRMVPRGEF